MRTRKPLADRTHEIITAGLALAVLHGYNKITRDQLAQATGLATGTINHVFGTMPQFQRAVMRHAVKQGNLAVIAQGLAHRDPIARRAPEELKNAAADSIK